MIPAVTIYVSPRQSRYSSERVTEAGPVGLISGFSLDNLDCPARVAVCQDGCCQDVGGRLHLDRVHSLLPLRNEVSHDGVCQDAYLHRLSDPAVSLRTHGQHWTARPFLVDARSPLIHRMISSSARLVCSDKSRKAGANAGYLFRQSEIFAEFGKGESGGFHS